MGYILNVEFDLQPEILPEATVPEAPKAKESRRKRKQETQKVVVEATTTDDSPGKSSSKRSKHMDSNPFSCW